MDAPAAQRAAMLVAARRAKGRVVDLRDTLIAGIALACEAQLATRNVRHVDDTTISLISLPSGSSGPAVPERNPGCGSDVPEGRPQSLVPVLSTETLWQRTSELAELSEQERLEAIEQGWSSRWLVALREHLHLKAAELEALLAMSEAILALRVRQEAPLELVPSERLDRLLNVISLAYTVFEDPASNEAWLKAPHPLLHQASPLQHCRTAIGATQVRRLLQAIEQGAPV